ncbi:MAG: hypothetical protein JJU29_14280 [Verrucomicrobia bacterium]|nr:hypothetical protein [Verrucomicrobiota bacterium]MCH8513340.1 LamG domain-containing protein [Kiritimatiellia bacterium]
MAIFGWLGMGQIHAEQAFDTQISARELRRETGAHTRFLWTHPLRRQGKMQHEDGLELWVLDSEDGKGARKIGASGNYHRPLFTADGKRIVWTDYPAREMRVINFDGSGLRTIGKGQMGEVWRDPETGVDWVYYRDLVEGEPRREGHLYEGGKTWRIQLDNPEIKELIWDRTPIGHASLFYLSLTADGRYAASAYPWAGNGVAEFPNGAYQKWHFGCWSGISPDASGRFFSFDGGHRFLHLFDWGGVNKREVRLDTMQEYDRGDVYYPRWTNHPDYLVLSHGPRAYLAKFNEDFTEIESYIKVADESHRLDRGNWLGHPDAWIDPGPEYVAPDTSHLEPLDAVAEVEGTWPGESEALVFAWKNRTARNRVYLADGSASPVEMRASGLSRYGSHWQMRLRDGQFTPTGNQAANRIVEAVKDAKAFSIELVVDRGLPRQDGTIMALETAEDDANLRIYQWLNRVNIELPRSVVHDRGANKGSPRRVYSVIMRNNAPTHLVFVYEAGNVDVYVDGEQLDRAHMGGMNPWEIDDFEAWADATKLVFGQRGDGSDSWQGQLEGISIHAIAMTPSEARARYQLYAPYLEDRADPPQSEVMARLISMTPVPSEQDMGIYSRALISNEYEVIRTVKGEPLSGKVVVHQYAVADRRPLPHVREWKIGEEYRLVLEPLDDHPELEGERLIDNIENFMAPVFFEVSHW